eukprot:TRINITY_DN10974_c0_g1_i1.p1 TRINITY_DN10974_c0_g1~~TRINITY_DN10974_c0_g1_i1.p1  ORF type:complete len:611 (+),score=99.91 TRINITY_DN10974_c0_g1_i1:57-1889(+)
MLRSRSDSDLDRDSKRRCKLAELPHDLIGVLLNNLTLRAALTLSETCHQFRSLLYETLTRIDLEGHVCSLKGSRDLLVRCANVRRFSTAGCFMDEALVFEPDTLLLHLTYLDLSCCSLQSAANLFQSCPNLRTLVLPGVVPPDFARDFALCNPALTSLTFQLSTAVMNRGPTGAHVSSQQKPQWGSYGVPIPHLPSLLHLSQDSAALVPYCPNLVSLETKSIDFETFPLTKLEELQLHPNDVVLKSSSFQRLTSLRVLRLGIGFSLYRSDAQKPFPFDTLSPLRLLEELYLPCRGTALTTEHLLALTTTRLRVLDLSANELIDDSLLSLVHRSPLLEHIDVSFTSISTNFVESVSTCTRLQSLNVRSCSVNHVLNLAPNVTLLDLAETQITNATLEAILQQCRHLTHLDISYTQGIEFDTLDVLPVHCPRLRVLKAEHVAFAHKVDLVELQRPYVHLETRDCGTAVMDLRFLLPKLNASNAEVVIVSQDFYPDDDTDCFVLDSLVTSPSGRLPFHLSLLRQNCFSPDVLRYRGCHYSGDGDFLDHSDTESEPLEYSYDTDTDSDSDSHDDEQSDTGDTAAPAEDAMERVDNLADSGLTDDVPSDEEDIYN